ncbi:MAG: arylsulfotransferase family protein, partial [Actinomycetota bacterium]|nr:arylsulfotransferase family protein [Actinomycetota bacterium]
MLAFSVIILLVRAASSSSESPAANGALRHVAGAGDVELRRRQGRTLTRLGADIDRLVENGAYNAKTTRRGFLRTAAGGLAWVTLGGSLAGAVSATGCETSELTRASASKVPAERAWAFRSRPDLRPPGITVTDPVRRTASGHLFCAPKNGPDEAGPGQDGCLILDDRGQPVWFRPVGSEAMDVMDFKLQSYRGRPVLTWWEGVHEGYGQGEYVLMDGSYREVARVRAGNGYDGDHHEFLLSPQDTALLDIYGKVSVDLSPYGGKADSAALEGIVQEVDIETGEVLFEWHSLEHVRIDESYTEPPDDPEVLYDYFHLNSIDVDLDGNFLVSARRTSAVYKIDRNSGEVIWRLGGKKSDFEMGPGTRTDWQHHARRRSDRTITIFDNGGVTTDGQSRGIVVELDEEAMTATLVREYTHPEKVFAATQGSMQILPNGNVFIGWGSEPLISEFDPEGELLFGARFPLEGESYRAFRFPWTGRPQDEPAVVAEAGPKEEEVTLYVSWNGATEVAEWEVLAGPDPESLEPVGSAPRKGFETALTTRT